MEELNHQKRLWKLQEKYLADDVEKDLAEEVELQRRTHSQPQSLESRVNYPSALYVAAALAGDACKTVAYIPLDYAVGLLPADMQKKLYGEKHQQAFITNCWLQPVVTGGAAYLLMWENLNSGNRAILTFLCTGAELVASLFRYAVLDDSGKTPGHPITTIPYYIFRASGELAAEAINYANSAYQKKKEEIMKKREEKVKNFKK